MKKDMQRLPQSFMGWRRRSESPMKIWALESYDLAVRYQQRNGEVGKPSKSDLEFQKLISREEGEFRVIVWISLRDCAAGILITKPVSDAVYNVELGGEKKSHALQESLFSEYTLKKSFTLFSWDDIHTFGCF